MFRFSLIAIFLTLALGARAEVDIGTTEPDLEKMKESIPQWREECARGRGFACGNLGALHALGKVLEQSDTKAYEFYTKACLLGQGVRCLRAGTMVLNGKGASESALKAVELFAKGCGVFDPDSCVNYYAVTHGMTINLEGETLPMKAGLTPPVADAKILQQVSTVLTLACNKAVGKACGNLGGLYEEGDAVQQDLARALNYYQRSCELGEAERCARAGRFLANGKGGQRDLQKAANSFTRYCELKKLPTCPLAHMARNGLPIEIKIPTAPESPTVSVPKIEARGGDPFKQAINLSKLEPVSKTPWARFPPEGPVPTEGLRPEVTELVEACNKGDARSCGNAGAALVDESGKPITWPETARRLYEKACLFGRAQRCADLARFHANGWGTEKSPERERAALARACELGHKESCGPGAQK